MMNLALLVTGEQVGQSLGIAGQDQVQDIEQRGEVDQYNDGDLDPVAYPAKHVRSALSQSVHRPIIARGMKSWA